MGGIDGSNRRAIEAQLVAYLLSTSLVANAIMKRRCAAIRRAEFFVSLGPNSTKERFELSRVKDTFGPYTAAQIEAERSHFVDRSAHVVGVQTTR